jgi:hypothetical protein
VDHSGAKGAPVQVSARVARALRPERVARGERISIAAAAVDCMFLGVVIAASLLPYVGDLGFYYDDYSVLRRMSLSEDQSLFGLYDAVRPATGQRPLQAFTFAALYRLFGADALGYHVWNAFVLVAIAALVYFVLRELRLPRLICVAVSLVYSTLPHYATNRFWVDAFQINVSIACYLLSLYAGLRAARASLRTLIPWLLIAVLGVVASLFAYEVVFPLFALNVGLIWWTRQRLEGDVDRRAAPIVTAALATAILAAGFTKLALVAEHGQNTYQVGFGDGYPHHLAYLISGSIKLYLGTYFVAFPYVIWWIFAHHFSVVNAAVAGIVGLFSFAYLWHLGRRRPNVFDTSSTSRVLIGVGLLAVVLGYVIFLTNQNVLFRSAGIDNRVNAGAALGLAGVLVGTIGWLVGRLEPRRRGIVFSTAVACAVAAGVFVIQTIGSFWTSAARQQRGIVTAIAQKSGSEPAWRTLILDGVCPENGPAVVFADEWDLTGALQVHYHDAPLMADVAQEAMRAAPRALEVDMTFLGRFSTRRYPYGPTLVIYDSTHGRLYRLVNRRQAARYLADLRPSVHCRPQRSFAWGFDPFARWSLL